MIIESENGHKLRNPTKKQIAMELSKLDGVSNSYISLEEDSESYIQAGGGPLEFTVEVRKVAQDGVFSHWKAELPNKINSGYRSMIISGSEVHVKSNQVLDLLMVNKLFESFMEGDYLPKVVKWVDMTDMFI